jgi:RNA polymerase sigma factor (sigma-70 family)
VTINIEQVIKGCQAFKRPAQETFYKHFYRYAMSICMPYAHSDFEAEEIVNDGFMKVFKGIGTYNTQMPVKGWLRKTMINAAIDHYRSQKKHYNQQDVMMIADQDDEHTNVLDDLAMEDIMKCVQKLPQAYRAVFTLYTIEGYKHHEIADLLEINEGTSKSNLAKAKAKLRTLLSVLKTDSI